MSSLTDIIFLLLIFFMLTSSVVSPTAINLKLPSSSKDAKNTERVEGPIKFNIDKRGNYRINGKSVPESNVRTTMVNMVNRDRRQPEDIIVILSIHEDVDAQTLVTNVDLLNDLGVKMILATQLSS